MDIDDFRETVCTSNYYIYGAGKMADRFFRLLEERNLIGNCRGFVTTSTRGDKHKHNKMELQAVDDIEQDNWFFIATDVTNYYEIKDLLNQRGITKYLWVIPIMFDLAFGPPLICNAAIDVKSLIQRVSCKKWIAICYLALEDYYHGNGFGKDYYIRFSENRFSQDVARKDLERFLYWSDKMRKNYNQEYNIKIDYNESFILDGAHRVALARYFNKRVIFANVYRCTDEMYQSFRGIPESIMSIDDNYVNRTFSNIEIKLIHDTVTKISN